MEKLIKDILLLNGPDLFGVQIDENTIQFQKTRKDVEGDLTLVIFPFVKMLTDRSGREDRRFIER